MRLCLGTVQFGMDYGIAGMKRPLISESVAMLEYAAANGIDTFDTAAGYALAEEIIGMWLVKNPGARNRVQIISKAAPCDLQQSLRRTGLEFLDGYLLHNPKDIFDDAIVHALAELKKSGAVKKIGVSVYEPREAQRGIFHPDIDMLQIPYNILDQRMTEIFPAAKEAGTILHARSVFLQGLILMNDGDLPDFLHKARPILRDLDEICRETGLNRKQLAMGYVKRENALSHLVFGVDNLQQLKEFISLFNQDYDSEIISKAAKKFENLDADIIMPNRWRR